MSGLQMIQHPGTAAAHRVSLSVKKYRVIVIDNLPAVLATMPQDPDTGLTIPMTNGNMADRLRPADYATNPKRAFRTRWKKSWQQIIDDYNDAHPDKIWVYLVRLPAAYAHTNLDFNRLPLVAGQNFDLAPIPPGIYQG